MSTARSTSRWSMCRERTSRPCSSESPEPALSRALALARQIASGLAAAHRAGIVHRDLKPANIMVDAHDQALLMDFGIARSTSAASIHTVPGSLIGTLDYMAPEQARGEPADERADVYAFGLILYELVAGGRPRSSNAGGLSSLLARLEKGPPALRTVVPDVAPALERIVNKCLSSSPEARYRSANELLADLETLDDQGRGRLTARTRPAWARVAAILLLGFALIAGTWWVASRRAPPPPPAPRAPLPVLIVDFENRAGDTIFDGALEQALSIAMEGAPFITAFPRREAAGLVRDLKLGPRLDEGSGRLLASREGIPVILAGMIEKTGGGYKIAVRAVTARETGAADGCRSHSLRQGAGPWRGRASSGARPGRARRHRQAGGRSGGDVYHCLSRSRALVHRGAGFVHQPEGHRGSGALPRGAPPRPGVRARLFRSGREPPPPRPARRGAKELGRGTPPHRPDDQPREAAHLRRLLPRHCPQLRQSDRDLRGAGREVSFRFSRLQQPRGRPISACCISARHSSMAARRSRSTPRPTNTGQTTPCTPCTPAIFRPPPPSRRR